MIARFMLTMLLGAGLMLPACAALPHHPEAQLYDAEADAMAAVDAALARAAERGTRVLIVMGANWCHDSRGLAGWFETERFAAMIVANYELVFVDAGQPRANLTNNLDVAQRFGVEQLNGTPNVLVVSAEGELLNPETATTWNDAASREEDAVFDYFAAFEPEV